ncbi:MAG: hypothetical protein LBS83_00690 [Holosporales bacterium]|jgi:chromosomal replication initiation ATPase DnaA|nr:hypothetical protein [Holosporales bacterium]
MRPRQLPLINKTDYSARKWVEADCNRVATRWVFGWSKERVDKLACFCGPRGSGKTHLVNIFKELHGAFEFFPNDCKTAPSEILEKIRLPSNPISSSKVEGAYEAQNRSVLDIHEDSSIEATNKFAEEIEFRKKSIEQKNAKNAFFFDNIENFKEDWLFNMYNIIKSFNASAIFTITTQPREWRFNLKDLESRLKATTIINIFPPDDNLIKSIIIKQTQDYSLYIDRQTIEYLVQRIPRDFESIVYWIKKINEISIMLKEKISKKLINQTLKSPDFMDDSGSV